MKSPATAFAVLALACGCLSSCGKKPDAAPAAGAKAATPEALPKLTQGKDLEARLGQPLTLEGRLVLSGSKAGYTGVELADGAFVVIPAFDRTRFSGLYETTLAVKGTLEKHMPRGPEYQDAEFIYLGHAQLTDGTSLQLPASGKPVADDPFGP